MNANQLFEIKDKVIVITGATGILGGEMARAVASLGAKISILGRNDVEGEQLQKELNSQGYKSSFHKVDVLDEESVENARDEIFRAWGKVDVLVNAAGGNMPGATIGPDQSIENLSVEDLKKVMELNYLGTVIPVQAFLKVFTKQKAGNIINISSMSAQRPLTRVMGYSSSKAAIDNYTKWMAIELATKFGEKMRVNAIAPGFFLTKQNKNLLTNEDGSLTDRGNSIVDHTPFKRFGQPSELVGTLVWLCSDASKFVTGTIIPVDGGFNAFSGV